MSRHAAWRFLLPGCMLLAALATGARAENFDIYAFETPEQEARFEALIAELRCPKCQNNNLADSNAPIARDLRDRTYELVREGRSDDEIVAYLKDRYGDFITYKPPFNAVTVLLWTGPFLVLLVAGGVLLVRLRRRRAQAVVAPDPARVREILSKFDPEQRP
ncbi:MAG: cytochrome c-type biogenesis protein CcmH [Gammaproteobacteria bacterium]